MTAQSNRLRRLRKLKFVTAVTEFLVENSGLYNRILAEIPRQCSLLYNDTEGELYPIAYDGRSLLDVELILLV